MMVSMKFCVVLCLFLVSSIMMAKPRIVVSIPPLVDFVQVIAGDQVEVESLVPEEGSAEFYSPTFFRLRTLKNADYVILLGSLPFESKIMSFLESKETVLVLSPSFKEGMNEHIWVSPAFAIESVTSLKDAFALKWPNLSSFFEQRAARYIEQLMALDQKNKTQFSKLRPGLLASYHPFLEPYCRAYGIPYFALEEHGKPFTARQLRSGIQTLTERQAQLIVVANLQHGEKMRPVATTLNIPLVTLNPLSRDYLNFHEELSGVIQDKMGYDNTK